MHISSTSSSHLTPLRQDRPAPAPWRQRSAASAFLVLLAALATPTQAATITVTNGSATTLRNAVANAIAGDTIIVTGTYNLGSTGLTTGHDGTAAKPITLTTGAAGATITGNVTGTIGNAALGINNDYWNVQNLNINGFRKSVRIDDASHGTLTNIRATNSVGESFKLRNFSQYWLIQNCTSTSSGAEGFYAGDADQNWENANAADTTGYITFLNCTATASTNDGFDCKEGTQNIKIINCTANFNFTTPGANDLGNSGIYDRCNNLQVINFNSLNNNSTGDAIRLHSILASDGITYGSNTQIRSVNAVSMEGYLLWNRQPDTTIYGYNMTDVTGGYLESGSYTPTGLPFTSFAEMTWPGEGGALYSLPIIPEPSSLALTIAPLALLRRRPRA